MADRVSQRTLTRNDAKAIATPFRSAVLAKKAADTALQDAMHHAVTNLMVRMAGPGPVAPNAAPPIPGSTDDQQEFEKEIQNLIDYSDQQLSSEGNTNAGQCSKNLRARLSNLFARYQKLKAEGKANFAGPTSDWAHSMRAATDDYLRCLNMPLRKRVAG